MNIVINKSNKIPFYKQIASQLEIMILNKELKKGERLPSIRSLAKELKVSVITVRQAYIDLQGSGFLNIVTGKGSFIENLDIKFIKEKQFKLITQYLSEAVKIAQDTKITYLELKDKLTIIYQENSLWQCMSIN